MRPWFAAILVSTALSATAAFAQEHPPSDRYVACRAAANGGDDRIDDICQLVDDIHERLRSRDAARHPARYAQLQHALGSALFAIGDLGDEVALRDSIVAEQTAAEHFTRERTPTYWAAPAADRRCVGHTR